MQQRVTKVMKVKDQLGRPVFGEEYAKEHGGDGGGKLKKQCVAERNGEKSFKALQKEQPKLKA